MQQADLNADRKIQFSEYMKLVLGADWSVTVHGSFELRDDKAWQRELQELAFEDYFGSGGLLDDSDVFRLDQLHQSAAPA